MQRVIRRLLVLGYDFVKRGDDIYVFLKHDFELKGRVISEKYFHKINKNGIIRGPFLHGNDLLPLTREIRQIDIFSKKHYICHYGTPEAGLPGMLQVKPERIFLTKIPVRMRVREEKMNEDLLKKFIHIKIKNTYYFCVRFKEDFIAGFEGNVYNSALQIEGSDYHFIYCEAVPKYHGVMLKIKFGINNFLFISTKFNYPKLSFSIEDKHCHTIIFNSLEWKDNSSLVECAKNKLLKEKAMPEVFWMLKLFRVWGRPIPKPIIQIILSMADFTWNKCEGSYL